MYTLLMLLKQPLYISISELPKCTSTSICGINQTKRFLLRGFQTDQFPNWFMTQPHKHVKYNAKTKQKPLSQGR